MVVFAHHAEAFFQIEVMGHPFPDGPTEHALLSAAVAVASLLMAYGAYAGLRDLLRWRRRRRAEAASPLAA
jgi:hypothetical protein